MHDIKGLKLYKSRGDSWVWKDEEMEVYTFKSGYKKLKVVKT